MQKHYTSPGKLAGQGGSAGGILIGRAITERPDIFAAAMANRTEAGLPLWKRLAYVAITRAQERLFWVTRAALARPRAGLSVDDLAAESLPLELSAPESESE